MSDTSSGLSAARVAVTRPQPVIHLDRSERWLAGQVAEKRAADALRLSRMPQLGARDLGADARGAMGELALARFTGLLWNAVRDDLRGLPDVGERYDSKAVDRPGLSLLIPRRKLVREWVYFLVLVADGGRCELLGAIEGVEVREADLDASLPYPAFRISLRDGRLIRGGDLDRYRASGLGGSDLRGAA